MLEEFKALRQVSGHSVIKRRLYSDDYFDLYIWYKNDSEDFTGFQLVFTVNETQMVLTAEAGKIPDIHRVDSGDGEFYSPTDIVDGVGYFPKDDLFEEFKKRSDLLDEYIRTNILEVISHYKETDTEGLNSIEPMKLKKN
ncbi:hypothetical protein [Oceanispirochaeta sp.]|jgi:hypothetical protein|uniref:hypothetical protein n=1 Tax=Oceanispirochaeta sp. TaxID=2035350 RepID=UPI00260CB5EA|nr:hypothetical protein [Oceanispirochaeta sp.]MDA3956278.1 hypothetical protein [Oceanispirochaeta sp.]